MWGGLLQQTTDVENYPGFPDGIEGPQLMQNFRDQAERFGTRFITDEATKVELADEPGGVHSVWVGDEEHKTRTVILAMGAEHKKLAIPGEEELGGRGVSYCATCDAAFFKEKPTMIVGGGDSAMEEAIFLSKFASKVVVVHRRDEFRASKIMLERARVDREHRVDDAVRARGVRRRRERLARPRAPAPRRDAARPTTSRSPASSSRSATSRSRSSSPARSTSTTRATSSPRAARRARSAPASSPPATSSTTRTARPSPPPARARRPRWTPSGTCATRRASSRPRACPRATSPRRSGRRPPSRAEPRPADAAATAVLKARGPETIPVPGP